MDLTTTGATGGTVATKPGRKRANSSAPWTNNLFTSAEAVEWLTIDKIDPTSTNPSTDTDRDGVPNTLEAKMGTLSTLRNSDGTGYADGDKLNQKLLPASVHFVVSTRRVEYEFNPEDPDCPYHPAHRLAVETDTPYQSDFDDALTTPTGLGEAFHTRLSTGAPFPSTAPLSSAMPLISEDGTAAVAPTAAASMGYTDEPDPVNPANSVEAADGTQQRVWLGIPEPLAHDSHYTLVVTRTLTNGGVTPAPTSSLVDLTIPTGSTRSSVPVNLAAKRAPGGTAANVEAKENAKHPVIEAAPGMAGVLGDTIPSMVPGSKVRHFVTPKMLTGANDPEPLKEPWVTLTATGITAEEITPDHAKQTMEWDPSAGVAVPGEPLKRKVSRSAPGLTELKIRLKTGGATAARMNIWVVWCDISHENLPGIFAPITSSAGPGVKWESPQPPNSGWRFKFTVQPAAIHSPNITEKPALQGDSEKDPPGYKKRYSVDASAGVGDTATKKWDVSRQMQTRIPNILFTASRKLSNGGMPYVYIERMNTSDPLPIKFPVNDAEGNDDPLSLDEECNPYGSYTAPAERPELAPLNHAAGELTSQDSPRSFMLNSWGEAGPARFSLETNFREFARLELWDRQRDYGNYWFRISNYLDWHHYIDVTYDSSSNVWTNTLGAGASSTSSGHTRP